MNDRKPNQKPGPCALCGETVAAGAGVLAGRTTGDDGRQSWRVEHVDCEPTLSTGETLWLHYGERGAAVYAGPPPEHADPSDYVPVTESARRMQATMPPGPMRTSVEWRVIMLARYGHTEATWNHGQPATEEAT